jgi:hypothetical protein
MTKTQFNLVFDIIREFERIAAEDQIFFELPHDGLVPEEHQGPVFSLQTVHFVPDRSAKSV